MSEVHCTGSRRPLKYQVVLGLTCCMKATQSSTPKKSVLSHDAPKERAKGSSLDRRLNPNSNVPGATVM